jgi:hypothetical protein
MTHGAVGAQTVVTVRLERPLSVALRQGGGEGG